MWVAEEDGISWTDRLDMLDDLRPRYQQLQRWSSAFTVRARRALPTLMAVAGLLNARIGAGLAAVAELAGGKRSTPLLTALALLVAIERTLNTDASVNLQAALFRLVGYLVVRPPPSHKMGRASGPCSRYYGLVI